MDVDPQGSAAGSLCPRATGGRPRLPIKAPRRHRRLKRGLEGRHQLLKFVERQTGHIQEQRNIMRCYAV
jgi:hypothetical protein